jgi:hypothetical protein
VNASVVFPSRREEEVSGVIAGERSSDVDCPTMTIEQSICSTTSHTVSALATAISASSARVSGHDREDEATSGDSAPPVANSSTAGKQTHTTHLIRHNFECNRPDRKECVQHSLGLFWFKHRTTTEETRTRGRICTLSHASTLNHSPRFTCTQGQALTNADSQPRMTSAHCMHSHSFPQTDAMPLRQPPIDAPHAARRLLR